MRAGKRAEVLGDRALIAERLSALPRYHGQNDMRRVRAVVQESLVRDDERAVALVIPARVQIAIVFRE